MQKIDTLIVGSGLAGINLAWQYLQNNQSFKLYHNPDLPAASRVAAGTWNPINFKRLEPTWRVGDLLKEMHQTYTTLETLLNCNFFEWLTIKKILANEEEQAFWQKEKYKKENIGYTDEDFDVFDKYTVAQINQGGRVNIPILLDAFLAYLKQKNCLVEEDFDYAQLHLLPNEVVYQNYLAQQVVFCEGVHVSRNPYFKNIPLNPAKGDVLYLEIPDLNMDYILKKNIFLLPLGAKKYLLGATYEWDDLTWENSPNARVELEEKLNKISAFKYTVLQQQSGIRPSSMDRRVIMGKHPVHSNLYCFNGLGAKGVLLAPFCAKELYQHIHHQTALSPENTISRFYKYF